jgi:hypothetical protein
LPARFSIWQRRGGGAAAQTAAQPDKEYIYSSGRLISIRSAQPPVTVALNPSQTVTVSQGSIPGPCFTATASSGAVTWSSSPALSHTSPTSTQACYPTEYPGDYIIRATSTENTAVSATVLLRVLATTALTITASATTVPVGGSTTLTTNLPATLDPVSIGSISGSGTSFTYTAPASVAGSATVTITARAVGNSSNVASVPVTVTQGLAIIPGPGVDVNRVQAGESVLLQTLPAQQATFSATYTGVAADDFAPSNRSGEVFYRAPEVWAAPGVGVTTRPVTVTATASGASPTIGLTLVEPVPTIELRALAVSPQSCQQQVSEACLAGTFAFQARSTARLKRPTVDIILMVLPVALDPGGQGDPRRCEVRLEPGPVGQHTMFALNGVAFDWTASTPGQRGYLGNDYCRLNLDATTLTMGEKDAAISLALEFTSVMAGQNAVYTKFQDSGISSPLTAFTFAQDWWVPEIVDLTPDASTLTSRQSIGITANKTVLWAVEGQGTVSTAGPSTSTTYASPQTVNSADVVRVRAVSSSSVLNSNRAVVNLAPPGLSTNATPSNPASGWGTYATFQARGFDTAGVNSSSVAFSLLLTANYSAAGSCYMVYLPVPNLVVLADDAGSFTQWGSPGENKVLYNSQCWLHLGYVTASASGNTVVLDPIIGFMPGYTGPKQVFLSMADGAQSVWDYWGTWTIP